VSLDSSVEVIFHKSPWGIQRGKRGVPGPGVSYWRRSLPATIVEELPGSERRR
jgi:hypothetical protein